MSQDAFDAGRTGCECGCSWFGTIHAMRMSGLTGIYIVRDAGQWCLFMAIEFPFPLWGKPVQESNQFKCES